ncbi:MAG: hypothetical protein LBV09_04425 [Deferribacteraceae bacterium]|jgi:hypothetical protein|nr:hypothetical protein [Deferribacteraceae bacterium]
MLFKLLYAIIALSIVGVALLFFIKVDSIPTEGTDSSYLPKQVEHVTIMNEKVRLAAGQLWFTTPQVLDDGENVTIKLTADAPVDLYVFPSSQRIDMKDHFEECARTSVTQTNFTCYINNGNAIAVFATYGEVGMAISLEVAR